MARDDNSILSPTPGVGTTVGEFTRLIERNVMINLRVGMPAKVTAWRGPVAAGVKSKPAMVDVRPELVFVVAINVPEELTAAEQADGWTLAQEGGGWVKKKALPVIRNVPVHYPGASDMMLRGPLRVGEVGWIKAADRSLDKWIQVGGPVDPGFAQFHDLTDTIFEPGLRYGTTAKPIDETKWTLGPEDDSAGLDIDTTTRDVTLRTSGPIVTIDSETSIKIGAAATLAAIRNTDPVNPGTNMTAWALQVESFINLILPGSFTPANSFGTTVAVPANSGRFGTCGTGSAKVTIE